MLEPLDTISDKEKYTADDAFQVFVSDKMMH